jgi:AsmA protein
MTRATSAAKGVQAHVKQRVLAKGSVVILGMFGCLFLAALVPMLFTNVAEERRANPARVKSASPGPFVVVSETQIMARPLVALRQASIFSDSIAGLRESEGELLLESPVFMADLSGAREAALADSSSPLIRTITNLGFARLFIENGRLTLTGMSRPDIQLTGLQSEVVVRSRGQISAKGQFDVAGQNVTFDATLSLPPEKSERPVDLYQYPLRLVLKTGGLTATLDGKADVLGSLRFEGNADIAATKARAILTWLGLPLKGRNGLATIAIRGGARWSDSVLAMDRAKIEIDGNEATGAVSIDHGASRPSIDATLSFQTLDLSKLFDGGPAALVNENLNLELWRALDADVRLSIKKLRFDGQELGSTAATITAKSGKLFADVPRSELLGRTGRLQVGFDASANPPAGKVRGTVEHPILSSFLAGIFTNATDIVSGRAQARIDLLASGPNLRELGRTVSGEIALTMPEGARLQTDLRQIKDVTASSPAGWSSLPPGRMFLNSLTVRALVKDGTIAVEQIQGVADDVTVTASGAVDVLRDVLNFRVNVAPRVPAEPVVSAKAAAARPPGDTIEIFGALGTPLVRPWSAPTTAATPRKGAN